MSGTVAYTSFRANLSKINNSTASIGNSSVTTDIPTSDPVIQIHPSCENVVKLDVGSPSDPMCVLFIPVDGKYVEVDRTEVVWNDPNPKWVKFFQTLYIFETHQPLRFNVYDCDSEKAPLSNHDFIGYADTDVQTIVSAGAEPVRLELKHPTASNKRGTLVLTCEQASQCASILQGKAVFRNLRKIHTFSNNNPYLLLARPSESGQPLPSYRSEVIHKAKSGSWRDFSIPLQNLCNGDLQSPIIISAYHFNKRAAGELIGSDTQNLQNILENVNAPIMLQTDKGKRAGEIRFPMLQLVRKPTFFDYLRSGLQLNLITAIDFTASNRNPTDPRSLHYIVPNQFNQYESCIFSVGSIVCPYDTDQLFPIFGFGGKVNGTVSHCFPLTFNPSNPNVQGLNGILGAYRESLSRVVLSGPTLFAPVISAATQVANASFAESHTYTILMILTDGVINDFQDTADAIVEATDCPLSIIIVGVGDADFSTMNRLDADDVPLKSRSGKTMKRDIVQFVPFNKFAQRSGVGLSTEVLAEIPRQVDQYCSTHGFIPNFN